MAKKHRHDADHADDHDEKPKAEAKAVASASPRPEAPGETSRRDRMVDAFMELLAERSFETIGLADVAHRADVSLADLRAEFSSKIAILAAHVKAIDRAVLASDFADMTEEPARERLFDVLMRRLELQEPHRDALRSLFRSAQTNPGLALTLNTMALTSQQWMLTAAAIPAHGPLGAVRTQGLVLLFADVMRSWLDDDEPGRARTMAALDRSLGRAQQVVSVLDQVGTFVPNVADAIGSLFGLARSRRRPHDDDPRDDARDDLDAARRDGIHPPPDREPPQGEAPVAV